MTTAERERQCMDALAYANSVRISNASLCREIAALPPVDGYERVAALLESTEQLALPVGRLVLSIRRVGEAHMARYLRHAGIFSPTKRVRDLTHRQRLALAYALRNRWLVL